MATATATAASVTNESGVNLHTEAKSIQDWEAVCGHVVDRAESMITESEAFAKLFEALMNTYQKYRDTTQEMRNSIATNKDYIDVPDYHATAIFQGFEIIIGCFNVMAQCYSELYDELVEMNKEINQVTEDVTRFTDKIVPQTNNEKQFYLQKESELQNIMQIYMKAAESNHPAFFIIARRYRAQLLQFQIIVKKSTDSMNEIIDKVQTKENEKKQFEISKQKQFVEKILTVQAQIKNVFNTAMEKIKSIDGKDAWDLLVEKLGIYNVSQALVEQTQSIENENESFEEENQDDDDDVEEEEFDEEDQQDEDEVASKNEKKRKKGKSDKRKRKTQTKSVENEESQRQLTIFDEPVPNTAGALIRSWLQRDMEMSAFVDVAGIGSALYMIVTRWGFVQIFKHKDDISALQEFYLYDYDANTSQSQTSKIMQLTVRQHRTFAPIKNAVANYQLRFQSEEACDKFSELLRQFQASHAPQT